MEQIQPKFFLAWEKEVLKGQNKKKERICHSRRRDPLYWGERWARRKGKEGKKCLITISECERRGIRVETTRLSNFSHFSFFFLFFLFFTQADALSLSPAHAFNQLFRQKTKVCSHPWIMEGEKAQRRMEVRNRSVKWQEVSLAQIFLYDRQPWTCCRQANVEELTGASRKVYIDQANTYINTRVKIWNVWSETVNFLFEGCSFGVNRLTIAPN